MLTVPMTLFCGAARTYSLDRYGQFTGGRDEKTSWSAAARVEFWILGRSQVRPVNIRPHLLAGHDTLGFPVYVDGQAFPASLVSVRDVSEVHASSAAPISEGEPILDGHPEPKVFEKHARLSP